MFFMVDIKDIELFEDDEDDFAADWEKVFGENVSICDL